MNNQIKMFCIQKISYLIRQNQFNLRFKTYIESDAYIKFEMEGSTKGNFENELTSLLGFKVSVTGENGYVNITFRNPSFKSIPLINILQSDFFNNCPGTLKIALGEDTEGARVAGDLEKWIHVLIAGETGGGKSVCLHNFINSLMYCCDTSILRLVLFDLNKVEFDIYNSISYLEKPIVNDIRHARDVLTWLIYEMNRRFDLFQKARVRNIQAYNKIDHLPYIVVIIDEFQNLTLKSKELENYIIDLVTQARKVGIHLILATQRPSADVVKPLIKANVPTRIAFSVSSHFDSQVILDCPGAEKLNKKGDMLLKDEDGITRIQGAYISEQDIENIVDDLEKIEIEDEEGTTNEVLDDDNELDELYFEAGCYLCQRSLASISSLRKYLNIGYSRALKLLKQLQVNGIIGEYLEQSKTYEVKKSLDDFKNEFKGGNCGAI